MLITNCHNGNKLSENIFSFLVTPEKSICILTTLCCFEVDSESPRHFVPVDYMEAPEEILRRRHDDKEVKPFAVLPVATDEESTAFILLLPVCPHGHI